MPCSCECNATREIGEEIFFLSWSNILLNSYLNQLRTACIAMQEALINIQRIMCTKGSVGRVSVDTIGQYLAGTTFSAHDPIQLPGTKSSIELSTLSVQDSL